MQYFISEIRLYSAFNKKCEEVQEKVRAINCTLMTSKDALHKVVDSVKSIVTDANGKYPQTKEFISGNVNNEFWKNLTQEQLDVMAEDADDLERLVYEWAGL